MRGSLGKVQTNLIGDQDGFVSETKKLVEDPEVLPSESQWRVCLQSQTQMKVNPSAEHHCSPEIKRRLLLGRKVMTNLDGIFKSRDITLPTKVHLIQAMVFPVVMYGCESWPVKKTVHQRIDAFEL